MVKIYPTKRGFSITRTACVVCGEPPFGDEYACGHPQTGALTADILLQDAKRNGIDQMLADVATARKNGVRFTPGAENFIADAIRTGKVPA